MEVLPNLRLQDWALFVLNYIIQERVCKYDAFASEIKLNLVTLQ